MMQQSCNGNMAGPCSCGYYHHGQTGNSFSMHFHRPYDQYDDQSSATASYYHQEMYDNGNHYPSSPPSSSSAAVDCTLSLGTPSTRLTVNNAAADAEKPRRSSYMRNFCWDILQSKQSSGHNKSSRGSYNTSSTNSGGGGEGLNARRCANCDTTSTPLWRNGPKGPKTLCNACGIRFKKEERRASEAAATNGNAGSGSSGGMDVHHQYMTNGSWVQHHHSPAAQRIPYFSSAAAYGGHDFRFMEDVDDRDSDTEIPYLSWRLNVTDRPGLVHDFTR